MNNNHSILLTIAILSCFFIYFLIPEEKKEGISTLDGVILTSVNGQQFRLAGQFTEKPILLVFWSTTCGSCIEEIPFISKLHSTMNDKITIIGIHFPNVPLKKVHKFLKKYKETIPYMLAIDNNDLLAKTYKVSILPRTLLIDKYGKVLYDHSGYTPECEKEVTDAISSFAVN